MKTRKVQNTTLRNVFQFLSMSLLVVAVLVGINLHHANASAPVESINAPTAFCDSVTEIPVSECEALVALYESTNGENWTNNTNWLETYTPSSWYGVMINSGHVTEIYLCGNWLTGLIPPELGNLSALQLLDLSSNQLTGGIPSELGNLSSLKSLVLSVNQLTGSIPPELGNLSPLLGLFLSHNQLTGSIPTELGNLASLGSLDLSNTQLSGSIPPELGDLSALIHLYLYSNQLTGSIPLSFINLSNLVTFWFSMTYLCEPTEQEYNVWKSTVFNYWGTEISCGGFSCSNVIEIPYTECEALVALYDSTGGENWENNTNWLVTNRTNDWYGVSVISGHVTQIGLMYNNLTGSVPTELGNLSALNTLDLDSNQLTGSIPPELGNLTNLVYLNLNNNQLSGSIPPELGKLMALQELYLGQNELTGSIPPELGNLLALSWLNLSSNQLSGSIPPELGYYSLLYNLDLSSNQLSGGIPPELGDRSSLVLLYLDNNHLSGEISSNITNLVYLYSCGIGYNALYTPDPNVVAFLDAKCLGWADTQTVAPGNIILNPISTTDLELTWTPITYTDGGGYYEVSYATNEAGPFSIGGITDDKTASGMTISDLTPGQDYYFRVRTLTATDWLGPTELWSNYSPILPVSMPEDNVYSLFLPATQK